MLELLLAHSWYPPTCCSDRDCRPLAIEEVVTGPIGYTAAGHTIPYNDKSIRRSLDGRYHICITTAGKVPCFYVPEGNT